MQRIQSHLRDDDDAQKRASHHHALWNELRGRQARARQGGAAAAGAPVPSAVPAKWPVRQRVDALLDEASPFLELAALAGCMDPQCPPGAGIVTGIGQVRGRTCMVIANDWQAKGGSYQPATLQKHLRAQAVAERERLPCIYLVDSGGIFLPRQAELFAGEQHFGRMFANQARMSGQGIPQIAAVLGMCTAGGAYVPAMADESILVRGQGTIFLAGPALVRAATGEIVDAQTLGGADTHGVHSGLVDHLAADEADAMALCQDIVAALGEPTHRAEKRMAHAADRAPKPPHFASEELARVLPVDPRLPLSMADVIARLVDDSAWRPFKPDYGAAVLCGTAYLEGQLVGIVANDGVLDGPAAQKGGHFVQLCVQRETPLLFVQNTTGFLVGAQAEAAGIAKDGAKLVQAVACAEVPKITLIVGGSYGAGNYAMCGRGLGPDFVFAWPNARIGVMGAEQAAGVWGELAARRAERRQAPLSAEALATLIAPIRQRYEEEASAYYATSSLWDDGLLLPTHTRRTLALAFACCRRRLPAASRLPVTRH